jgi:glycosyltransferase involved in cell wall biosynthesis
MSGTSLVCVGLKDSDVLPAGIQALFDTGLFDALIRVPMPSGRGERYWCGVIERLPDAVDKSLVITADAGVTLDILRLAKLMDSRIAVALPLSLQHDIARPLIKPQEAMSFSTADLNHWLNRYAVGKPLDVPLLAGFCGWVSAKALREVDAQDDFALAEGLRRHGYSILLSDEAFVDDSASDAMPNSEKQLPESLAVAVTDRHPYIALRHPLSQLNERIELPPKVLQRGPGALLHISHSWGGGLWRWISDFCSAEEDFLHLVLKSVGTRKAGAQALTLHLGAAPVPLKQWNLTTPIQSTSLGSHEYRQILAEIQASFSVQGILVSTLIGHSLDLYDLNVPTIQVLHDYYPWCPPLYATWDKPCSTCDGERLGQCLQKNPAHQFFGEEKLDWYLALREGLMDKITSRDIPVVAPSQSVRTRWQQLAPPLQGYPVQVIGHGLPDWELEAFDECSWDANTGDKLHLLVLGVLSDHKGGKTLKRLMPELLKKYRVTLLGTGEDAPSFDQHPDLKVVKWYQLPELPQTLRSLKPDLGLLLSNVPETFSYTLSELFAAGIPPVASRLGAFADRIEDGVTGWLVSPSGDDLLDRLSELDQSRDELSAIRSRLIETPQRSTTGVAKDYLKLIPGASSRQGDRPLCRSVVADSGVSLDQGDPTQKAMFVRPGASYRLALFQFLLYSHNKCQESPQLSRITRTLLGWALRVGMRLSRPW